MSAWYVYTAAAFPRTAAGPFPAKEEARAHAEAHFAGQDWAIAREEVCREIEQTTAEVRAQAAWRKKVHGG